MTRQFADGECIREPSCMCGALFAVDRRRCPHFRPIVQQENTANAR